MNNTGKGPLARLMEYIIKRHKTAFAFVITCIIISVVAAMCGSLLLQIVIDDYILEMVETGNNLFAALAKILALMACIYAVGAIGTLLYNRNIATIGQKVLKEIRDDLFSKMQTFPIRFFDTHAHGDVMSVYTNDTDTLRQMISQSIPQMISSFITIAFSLSLMLHFSLYLALAVILLTILMLMTARVMLRRSRRFFSQQQDSIGKLNGYIEEIFGGQKIVKVFCHEDKTNEELRKINDDLYNDSLHANGSSIVMMPLLAGIGNLQYLTVAILGGVMALFGEDSFSMTIGTLISFLGLVRQFTSSITQTSQQMNSVVLGLAGAGRIFSLMDNEAEEDNGYVTLVNARKMDGELIEDSNGTIKAWKHPHHDGTTTYTEVRGNVVFDHIDFSYDGKKTILHDISLYAKPGQKNRFRRSNRRRKDDYYKPHKPFLRYRRWKNQI